MPRVSYPENEDFRAGTDQDPETLNMDFCRNCFNDGAWKKHIPEEVLDTDWVTVGDDHPEYDDTTYKCDHCNKPLTGKDD